MSSIPVWMRQPTTKPAIDMKTIGSSARIRLATAWPDRRVAREMGSEWKRSMAPLLRSWARAMATPKAPKTIVWAKMPPIRNSL